MKKLVLLRLPRSSPRRLRREVRGRARLGQDRALQRDPRLLPERRPRRPLCRPGRGRLRPRGPRRRTQAAARPERSAGAAPKRPGRRRHLLRARAAAGPRQGRRPRRRRRARAEAADHADDPGRQHQQPGGPARQAHRDGRIALPDRLSPDDPPQCRHRPEQVKETHVGFNLVPAMLSRDVDATLGAFWNYEAPTCAAAGASRRSCGWRSSASRSTTSSCSSPVARTSTRASRPSCGASCAPPPRATSACARTRTSAWTRY